ncbi:hypothetical protein [Pseudaestuariivita atlantica]|uniref:Uncharacterized protein n=1 Tax=Pseudaestuariivita atlantica TaxID=1317121 RepID=A0A0L1JTB0_9RHOB|nr:hypothetical protein [Pseudaestuariivita atlantica]KNG94980.1 hypothetical protein ATO11_06350 [Pseudaestuariivita atlantica]
MKPLVPVFACLALAGCLGNGTVTRDVELSKGAYEMLYGEGTFAAAQAAGKPAPAPAKKQTGGFKGNDAVELIVPASAPAAAPAPRVAAAPKTATVRAPAPRPAPAPRRAPAPAAAPAPVDTCGAGQFAGLVGGPASAVTAAALPSLSRIYGANETIDPRRTPARVNVVVSTDNPAEAIAGNGTVTRIFCG